VELEFEQAELEGLRRSTVSLLLDVKLLGIALRLKAGYRADQPRVPAGNPDGGQWTDGDGGSSAIRISRRVGRGQVRINGRWQTATPAQEARLAVSVGEMQAALRAVRKIDPRWKPIPQAYETIEGYIRANEAIAAEAYFRLFQLRQTPVGPGPYAQEWLPAPSTNRRFNAAEQSEINRLGRTFGCHRCGTKTPGTPSGSFIGDHQMPKRLGKPTRIYPHCLWCSATQGGLIRNRRY
jgi:hypothetical protein